MTITAFYYKWNNHKIKTLLIILGVSLSTFLGGLIMFIFKDLILNDLILGSILSITLGMLIYIIVFELVPHLNEEKNKANNILGVILGIIIFLISMFLE